MNKLIYCFNRNNFHANLLEVSWHMLLFNQNSQTKSFLLKTILCQIIHWRKEGKIRAVFALVQAKKHQQ
jgi:hypothetical protein